MLAFLERLTLRPAEVGPADAKRVLDAGVSEQAFADALYVQAMFQFITRCADAYHFHVPEEADFQASAQSLLRRGYQL